MSGSSTPLASLLRAIARGDEHVLETIDGSPELATASLTIGATRADPETWFLDEIQHHVNRGDTALHVAAAAHAPLIALRLLARGANVAARNRLGAEPLHYAADGGPTHRRWTPSAQAAVIACLLAAGADPNASDKRGVTALHRAIRHRSTAAVRALLDGGADVRRPNKSGSTPFDLAQGTTGKGGSGAPEAVAEQRLILELLRERGGAPRSK